jgi:hypothetical protein
MNFSKQCLSLALVTMLFAAGAQAQWGSLFGGGGNGGGNNGFGGFATPAGNKAVLACLFRSPPVRQLCGKLLKQPNGVQAIDNAVAQAIQGSAISGSRANAKATLAGDALALR